MAKAKEPFIYDLVINDLVVMYRNTQNERYLKMLMDQIKGLVAIIVMPYKETIPYVEFEDLVSEGYIILLKVIEDYDQYRGRAFSTLLKTYIQQHLNRLYNQATRKKRFTGSTPVSYESLIEINREGGSEGDTFFTVECEDFNSVEFADLVASLGLNEKEQVAVNILMAGGTKGDVAKALTCTPATANYYFKQIRKKFVMAGYTF